MTPEIQTRPATSQVALAYSNGGTRFAPPSAAAWWRVKRFGKTGRGAGELVYASDGLPLFIPIDADHASLRAAVGDKPGKYKLDPVDEDHNELESPSAYVVLGGDDVGTIDMRDEMIYRLVRSNKEVTETVVEKFETVVEKFALVMNAAANVLSAADGAGLPQRRPVQPVVQVMESSLRDPEASRDPKASGMDRLASIAEQFSPLLGHLMCTKLIGLSDEETATLMGSTGAAKAALPAPTQTALRIEPSAPSTTEASTAGSPSLTEKLAQVMAQLTAEERQSALLLARGLSSDDRQRWMQTLLSMSVADAVAEVRNVVRRARDAEAVMAAAANPPPATPAPVPPSPAPGAARAATSDAPAPPAPVVPSSAPTAAATASPAPSSSPATATTVPTGSATPSSSSSATPWRPTKKKRTKAKRRKRR